MSDWSTSPPDAPGFYWLRDEQEGARVVHVVYGLGGLRAAIPGVDGDAALDALVRAEWRGPLERPAAWTPDEPTGPGWYWVKGPRRVATVVLLFRPWPGEGPLWVAATGEPEQPLRRGGFRGCVWAGPLAP